MIVIAGGKHEANPGSPAAILLGVNQPLQLLYYTVTRVTRIAQGYAIICSRDVNQCMVNDLPFLNSNLEFLLSEASVLFYIGFLNRHDSQFSANMG